jgi:hypothetical protein
MGLTFPGLGYVFFYIPMQREALTTTREAMLTHGFFPFQHPYRVENSIDPREISIASTLC